MHEYTGCCKERNKILEMAHISILLHDRARIPDEFIGVSGIQIKKPLKIQRPDY
jgi:hypothetical protein